MLVRDSIRWKPGTLSYTASPNAKLMRCNKKQPLCLFKFFFYGAHKFQGGKDPWWMVLIKGLSFLNSNLSVIVKWLFQLMEYVNLRPWVAKPLQPPSCEEGAGRGQEEPAPTSCWHLLILSTQGVTDSRHQIPSSQKLLWCLGIFC